MCWKILIKNKIMQDPKKTRDNIINVTVIVVWLWTTWYIMQAIFQHA